MKVLIKIAVILVILVVILAVTKDFIIKGVIEKGVAFMTGLRLEIQSLNISILKTRVRIQGLIIYNPQGFEERIMLAMPEILIDYHLGDIIKGLIHLESVIIDLQAFNVVKNKDNILNLDSLKVVQEGKEKEKEKRDVVTKKKKGKAPRFQIDYLKLKLGTISFKNFTNQKRFPTSNDFVFNLDEEYTNITRPEIIIAIIVQKAILKASVAKLSGFDLDSIQGAVTAAVGDVQKFATEALGSAKALAGGAIDTVKKLPVSVDGVKSLGGGTAVSAKETAEEAVVALKDQASKLKGLAGKLKTSLTK
ncbi:MAG: hypothetical protein KKH94_08385 [Candidatus Omnitrophica bacterium]|nr:hypothetical protein [Candidatus Omnitrophota bacterium]